MSVRWQGRKKIRILFFKEKNEKGLEVKKKENPSVLFYKKKGCALSF